VKLAIMQPYLFPYLGYFQLVHAVDRFVIYDDVAFIKQGWINRNRLLVNDRATYFTVPLRLASSFRQIRETEIDDGPQNTRWRDKLLKTFDNAYRRAPQFREVFPMLEDVFRRPTTSIGELAAASIAAVARFLGIATELVPSSTTYGNAHLTGPARVIDICRVERATMYVNPPGGTELYDSAEFNRAGVALRFLRPQPTEYRQFGAPFVKDLSIIDLLMFNAAGVVRGLLDRYELA
jgi:hypothetical protein